MQSSLLVRTGKPTVPPHSEEELGLTRALMETTSGTGDRLGGSKEGEEDAMEDIETLMLRWVENRL